MLAGNRKPHGPHRRPTTLGGLVCQPNMSDRADAVLFPADQRRGQVITGSTAVAQDPHTASGTSVRQRRRAGVVGARHQHPAGPQSFDEGVEYRRIGLGATEEIEMIGLHIGHDRDIGRVLQQRTVAFVGLGDEHLTTAVMSVGAGLTQVAAYREGGIKAAVLQGDDEHRGGRRLAVGAADHQRAVTRHELCQHDRSQEHRDPAAAGLHQFRVGLGDGGMGGDNRRRTAGQEVEVCLVMADADLGTAGPQCDDATRLFGVRTRYQSAPVEQDSGDPGHARPADPHHVHPLEFGRQCAHRSDSRSARATLRTLSATR